MAAPPPAPFEACAQAPGQVSSQSLVRYETNDYSVPVAYGHRDVWVRGYVERVVIGCGGEVIARHPRSYEREDTIFEPIHYLPLIEQKIGALDQAAPLAGWELPPAFQSRKGERKLDRKPRRRGGKARKRGLSREQVPILVAADRAGATLSHTLPALNAKSVKEALEPVVARDALLVSDANRCYPPVAAALDILHESINGAAGERVRGALRIQTVNSRHSQIKGFLRGFRGIATKYLDSYLRWFHLIELGDQPSPRACLEAAMARPCLRSAN